MKDAVYHHVSCCCSTRTKAVKQVRSVCEQTTVTSTTLALQPVMLRSAVLHSA